MRRCVALILLGALILGLTGCRRTPAETTPTEDSQDYDARSQELYDEALGAFYEAYRQALEADSVSHRYALMAVAEAKLLGSAVMLPLTAGGGSYTISRAVPYTAPYALWGNDDERLYGMLVTTQPIKAEDAQQLKQQWVERKGSGTYRAWAEEYLSGAGYQFKDSYREGYSSDPKTWDALATSRASDMDAIVNTYDGLYQYDCEGVLQPGLAESYEVRHGDDGTVRYVFYLREGLKWVDSQGREVAPVQADDFVAGFQHMMDAAGGLEYLVEGVIQGAAEYISGEITDMEQVGVLAEDERTVVYTLAEDVPYFMTMLGYSVFAPMSRTYYVSKGGRFGADFDASAKDYLYGKDPNSIAYCGAYLVTNATAENTIVYSANPAYWNTEQVRLKSVVWRYNDGKDALKGYTDTVSGAIDGTKLNVSAIEKAKADGTFQKYAYAAPKEATTYFGFYNLNRLAFSNFNDGAAQSGKTEVAAQRASEAMRNVHFRRAISYAVDRAAYNAQSAGEELKEATLRNTFTPGNFVALSQAVTLKIGSEEKTYAPGTYYGQILHDQLQADGLAVKAWDPQADEGLGSSDGFDGWFNPEAAVAELAKAQQELDFDADDPIEIDLPYFSGSDTQTNRANAYRQSIQQVLGGAVRVNLVPCADSNQVHYAGYYIGMGYEANYDVYDLSGWGPDYGDPQTYLSSLLPNYEGYMTRMLGIF